MLRYFSDRYWLWVFESLLSSLWIVALNMTGHWSKLLSEFCHVAMSSAQTIANTSTTFLQKVFGRSQKQLDGEGGLRLGAKSTMSVTHSDEYWRRVWLFYGAFSLAVFRIPLQTGGGYRIILSLYNLGIALYLCIFNLWFKTKIYKFMERIKND